MHRRLLLKLTSLIAISVLVVLLLPSAATTQEKVPNTGSLLAFADGKPAGECPLKHTSVKAEVSGFLSRVTVTQDFENPFKEKIEAFYSFPLPQAAAVDDMTMLIGDRTVKGKIMRREEAQTAYAAAKQLGKVAALLDQQRPNIFTQSVANILPGQQIRIVISYVETLKYEDGSYEWSFPMVVGPRYNPASDQPTPEPTPEVTTIPSVAAPIEGMRPGYDISLELAIDAGVPLESLNSKTHETEIDRPDPTRALIRLKDQNTIPNKDFVLTYQVAGPAINDAVLAHRNARGGFFTLILQPPQRISAEDVMPKELVFVLDTSGSMSGFPIETGKETMRLALDNLYPHDTFNLITFSGDTRILFPQPVPATPENLAKAKEFLAEHRGDGGTEMMKAIKAALKPSDSQQHVRIVCFMTDGHVGDDMKIIGEVKKYKNARVFAMGIGSSPNRFLLDNMAKYGRGEVDYVMDNTDASAVARRLNERVRSPLLTDISIDWSTLPVTDIYPARIPDLFGVKPLIISGRYLRGANGTIVLRGKTAGQDFVREIPVQLPENENSHDVLATLWARRKVDDLMGQDMDGMQSGNMKKEPREEITQLGLKFNLMTQFTSFVGIDEVIFTGPEPARPASVPLNIPAGTVTNSGVAEIVTVTAGANSTMVSGQTSHGANITVQQIQNLPLQGRSIQSLVTLAPGTVAGKEQEFSPANLSTNGQRPNANMYTLDGVSANFGIAAGGQNPGPSAAGSTPALTASGGANGLVSLGATQEMSITTAYTEAQYGRMPGAQVNVVTRAGNNEFHGSLFHFFGNDALDANDWFANSRGLAKPPRRLNNFGGTFGGPIVRDQTFFFASYEGLRLRKPMTGITDVPSLASRANAVPEIQPFLNAFPLPTGAARPDGFAEFAATFANAARHDVGSLRVDHTRNQWNFSGKYNFADSEADERGAGGFSLNTLAHTRSRAQTITGWVDKTLSPTAIFNIHANYSRLKVSRSYDVDEFGGAVNVLPDSLASLNFDLNARGAALLIGDKASSVQRQFNLLGSTEIISGSHTFKFGADYRRLSPIIGSRILEESVLFEGMDQAMTGTPARVGVFRRAPSQKPTFNNLSLYAQDEWRQSSRLTLTYGLRWELNPPPSIDDTNPIMPIAVDQIDDPAQLKAATPGTSLWQTTFLNFAPRFGFAYNLVDKNDPKLIVRGGVGVLYDLGHERAGDVFADSIPFVSGGPDVPAIVFDPQLKLPYTLNWNLSIEQSLGSNQSITASYVGAAGRRLLHTQTLFDQNPDFPFLRLTTNAGRSDYQALQVRFNRSHSDGLSSNVAYTLARSLDNVSEDSARAVLMTSANPALDRGPSDFDVRHQLTGLVSYDIPALFSTGLGNNLFRNWSVDSIFNARSARPVNAVYMFPTSFGVAYFRPELVAGQPLYIVDSNVAGGRTINPAAFSTPLDLEQGTLGRNSLRGFPVYQLDLALRRRFNFSETTSLQFQADAFNLFNHPNFEDPLGRDRVLGTVFANAFTPNSTFGQSSSLLGQSLSGSGGAFGSFYNNGSPRVLRFSLRLQF